MPASEDATRILALGAYPDDLEIFIGGATDGHGLR